MHDNYGLCHHEFRRAAVYQLVQIVVSVIIRAWIALQINSMDCDDREQRGQQLRRVRDRMERWAVSTKQ